MGRPIARLVLLIALVAAACGDDEPVLSTTTPPDAGDFPVTVRDTNIPALPERIVSLSATHTEVLFEIGAGPQIVATDVFSDHPAAAAGTMKVDAFNLSVEGVAELEPDLVIMAFDPGEAMSGLAALGIPAILFAPPGPSDLEQAYAEWIDLGKASGHEAEARDLADQVKRDIGAIVDRVPETVRAFSYYVELDPSLFSVGPGTLLDSLFGMLGLVNIVDDSAGSYPQLSSESVIAADPDFIFLADTVCCDQTAATLADRPGWEELSAIRNGNVVELDDSIASRWSHRVFDLVFTIAKEVYGI